MLFCKSVLMPLIWLGFTVLTDMLCDDSRLTETRICLNLCCLDLGNTLFSIVAAGEKYYFLRSNRDYPLKVSAYS